MNAGAAEPEFDELARLRREIRDLQQELNAPQKALPNSSPDLPAQLALGRAVADFRAAQTTAADAIAADAIAAISEGVPERADEDIQGRTFDHDLDLEPEQEPDSPWQRICSCARAPGGSDRHSQPAEPVVDTESVVAVTGELRSQERQGVINEPGHWDVMLSYTQRNYTSEAIVHAVYGELVKRGKTVWLDVKMSKRDEAAMEEGAKNVECMIAVVSGPQLGFSEDTAYFRRPMCLQELQWATEAEVFVQPVVAAADKGKITELFGDIPADLQYLKRVNWEHLDIKDIDYFELGVSKILREVDARAALGLRRARRSTVVGRLDAASSTAVEAYTPTSWRGLTGLLECELVAEAQLHIRSRTEMWQLVRQLEDCAYGTVWLAEQMQQGQGVASSTSSPRGSSWTRTGKYVAVKQMSKVRISEHENQLYEDTAGEIEMLRKLHDDPDRSESIVDFVAVGHDEAYLYLLLEFVSQHPQKPVHLELLEHVQAQPFGRLTEPEARLIFSDLINALAHLHHRGIYHLDVSLENILMRHKGKKANGGIKLVDFGLAMSDRISSEGALSRTVSGTALPSRPAGKLGYAAPEVFRNENFDGAGADLWSAAAVLFTLLTGKFLYSMPTEADSSFAALATRSETDFFPRGGLRRLLKQRNLSVSIAAEDLLSRMLVPDRVDARLTLRQVREHAWLQDESAWKVIGPQSQPPVHTDAPPQEEANEHAEDLARAAADLELNLGRQQSGSLPDQAISAARARLASLQALNGSATRVSSIRV
jgi:serine/threonine protein kinase